MFVLLSKSHGFPPVFAVHNALSIVTLLHSSLVTLYTTNANMRISLIFTLVSTAAAFPIAKKLDNKPGGLNLKYF